MVTLLTTTTITCTMRASEVRVERTPLRAPPSSRLHPGQPEYSRLSDMFMMFVMFRLLFMYLQIWSNIVNAIAVGVVDVLVVEVCAVLAVVNVAVVVSVVVVIVGYVFVFVHVILLLLELVMLLLLFKWLLLLQFSCWCLVVMLFLVGSGRVFSFYCYTAVVPSLC